MLLIFFKWGPKQTRTYKTTHMRWKMTSTPFKVITLQMYLLYYTAYRPDWYVGFCFLTEGPIVLVRSTTIVPLWVFLLVLTIQKPRVLNSSKNNVQYLCIIFCNSNTTSCVPWCIYMSLNRPTPVYFIPFTVVLLGEPYHFWVSTWTI